MPATVSAVTPHPSPWLIDRADLLLERLRAFSLELPTEAAQRHISDHLDLVAARMRIGRPAAKMYVTDEVIRKMAARLAGYVEQHTAAVQAGDIADLDQKRRERFPYPPDPAATS